jgi:hypothetical protein
MSRLLLLTLLLAPLPAIAQSIAVLEFRQAEMPKALVEQVRQRLLRTLAAQGYKEVLAEDLVAKKIREQSMPPGCTIGPCLSRVGRLLRVGRALTGGISGQGSSYDLSLTLLETGGGTALAQVTQRCDICNFKEVEDTAARALEQLQRQALVYLSTRATLTVTSTPPGATMILDGLPVGQTPVTVIIAPGRHAIEASAKGATTVRRSVALQAGKEVALKLSLPAAQIVLPPPPPPVVRRGRVPGWVRWTTLGAGIGLGAVGGALWGIDGREKSDARYVHDTKAAGITLVTLGAGALVSCGLIYLLDRPTTREARHPQAAVYHR